MEQELAGLPGKYAPPDGRLLVARADGRPAGVVALRRFGQDAAEMKRMFVRPESRGRGIGRLLAERLIEEARIVGYRTVLLDTVPAHMVAAQSLYRSLGFEPIERFNENPTDGVMHMGLRL